MTAMTTVLDRHRPTAECKHKTEGTKHQLRDVVDGPLPIMPISLRKLIDDNPTLQPVVVDGLLRQGETANLIASAKTGKSFLAGQLALCIAAGIPWLGHNVKQGRVLVIDNELHPATLADRLHRISEAMGRFSCHLRRFR